MMPHKKHDMYILLLSITMFLSACVSTGDKPVKAYHGPERPASELAVIKCVSLKITAMDENTQYTCEPFEKLHVLPGQHTFEVWMAMDIRGGTVRSKRAKRVSFNPTAGHTYFIMAGEDKENKYKQDNWYVVIMDTDTSDKGEGWILHPDKAIMNKK